MEARARRRRLAGVISIITALCTLPACGSGTTDSAGAAGSGPEIRIGVGVDAAYAPLFLADSRGLWKKHGLNVKLVQFGTGGQALDALTAGTVNLAGNSDVTTIGKLPQDPGLRALLVYEESGHFLKVVTRPAISDPSKIRKMAIVPGLSELAATRFLQSRRIDPKSVKFVTADPPEIPALLQKGDVDAYVLWEPWPAKGVALGGKVLEDSGSYGLVYQHWLVSTQKWLDGDKDTAQKVAQTLAEAARLTESDPDAAAKATEKAAKIPTSQTLTAVREIDYGVRGITAADVRNYARTADWFLGTGKVKSKPDVTTGVLQNWYTGQPKGTG
ncbi:ABC transporter substrate-binding protein [Spirillospora sp. NPDC046719]